MKRAYWISLCGVLALLVAAGAVITVRQRAELLSENGELRSQAKRLQELLSTAARPQPSPGAVGLSPRERQRLRGLGLADPEADLRADLVRHPEIIPFSGVLGGTPGFHDPRRIIFLPDRWVYAAFDDGHVEGRLIVSWEVGDGGMIAWRVVSAECSACSR